MINFFYTKPNESKMAAQTVPMSLRGCVEWMRQTSYFVNNEKLQADFKAFLADEKNAAAHVDALLRDINAMHNTQWSEHLFNIIDKRFLCPHDCKYCYMKPFRERVWKVKPQAVTDVENAAALLTAQADKKWSTVRTDERRHVIMFPTSHDIIPQIVPAYIEQAKRMLDAGHALLVVSKPHMEVMKQLADAFEGQYKDRVVFRFTISSVDPWVLAFWEPGAPPLEERLAALKMLHERGFVTSVSIEPYLSDPRAIVAAVEPYVSETIWIGMMSGFSEAKKGAELRQQEANWLSSGIKAKPMAELLSIDYVKSFVHDLSSNPKVYWKTSVMKLLVKGMTKKPAAKPRAKKT